MHSIVTPAMFRLIFMHRMTDQVKRLLRHGLERIGTQYDPAVDASEVARLFHHFSAAI